MAHAAADLHGERKLIWRGTWYVIDAAGQRLGRLASQVAHVLRGKHKPEYTPHIDCGDYVIVINADKSRAQRQQVGEKDLLQT